MSYDTRWVSYDTRVGVIWHQSRCHMTPSSIKYLNNSGKNQYFSKIKVVPISMHARGVFPILILLKIRHRVGVIWRWWVSSDARWVSSDAGGCQVTPGGCHMTPCQDLPYWNLYYFKTRNRFIKINWHGTFKGK